MYCKKLADLDENEEKIVGGKAWNLSLLLKQHVPAPGGFVIFAKAFEEYLEANKINFATCTPEEILKADTIWPDQLTRELTEQMKELSSTVTESTRYAVRSSGLLEDSAKLSFAGIHESILMVDKEDILKALKECWSSTRTERAINYRKVNDLPESPNLAVLIQPMISSKISGVLFSVNPMTSADEIIVEAAEGYCDQIVSGKVTPEKITIQKKEENHSKSEVVPLELCKLLKETALKIESYFKYPVDVEWTWDGEKLWILQARPITKKGEISESQGGDGRKDLYSNKNSKEVMGHAVTMMTWSAFNTIINKALKRRYKQKGIKYSKKQPFYELKWGRVFQNVTTTHKLMAKEFGADLKTICKEFEEISPEILTANLPHEKSSKIKGLSNILGHLFKSKEFIEKAEKNWREYNDFCLKMRAKELHQFDEQKLFEIFNEVQETFVDFGKIYMDLQIYLSIFKEVVWQGIEKKENNTQLFASLLTGLGDVVTVEQDEKLLEIAALIKENEDAKEFFKQASDKLDWKELRSLLSERSPIIKELQEFIVKYGYRSKIELEVSEPRWSDAPSDILKFLQISVNATSSTRQSKIDLLEQRHNSEKKVVAAQNIFLRPVYSWAVSKFQAMSRLRENCKAVVVHFIAVQRRILLVIGSKLLENKRLLDIEDIFHISVEELETILAGKWDLTITQEHVTKNRTKLLKDRKLSPPYAFLGEEPLFKTVDTEASMKGTAASPGQVTGKALVLDSPTQVTHIEPGTVLIASTTDPYWTPLFMHVVAVVTEHGGLLSHAAITAREFGLPAVLGVNNVTQTIKSGTEVFVDGSNGVIKIIEKATE